MKRHTLATWAAARRRACAAERLRLLLPLGLALSVSQCAYLGRQASIAYLAVEKALTTDEVKISIGRSFIEAYKDRVSIRASFTVDEVSKFVNPAPLDGDLHISGRAPEIGLPLVAEIANASSADAAVALVRRADHEHRTLDMVGPWRLWPEHAGNSKEEQGDSLKPLEHANANHVFELHPVTMLGGIDLLETLHPVSGYSPGTASRTFGIYGRAHCSLTFTSKTVSLVTPTGLYNDVEFLMELTADPQQVVPDGRFVMASALDLHGKLLVDRLRMVFVKGSPPERLVRALKPGDRLHVWAMPRVSFAELSRRMRESASASDASNDKLPYELLVVGVYPDHK